MTYDNKVFLNFYKMFQVAIIFIVSKATCERSFSTMRRIKTWLRTSMNQDRFRNVSMLNIESDIIINRTEFYHLLLSIIYFYHLHICFTQSHKKQSKKQNMFRAETKLVLKLYFTYKCIFWFKSIYLSFYTYRCIF